MSLTQFLTDLHSRNGSDLILKVGRPPLMRLDGQLLASEFDVQTEDSIRKSLGPILTKRHLAKLEDEREIDLSFEIEGMARFRVNVFHQRNRLGTVIRVIPLETPTIDLLKLPPVLKDVSAHKTGIVLVTGPTGSGKSTTMAAMVEHINQTRHAHIITIEDPVEFVYTDKKATVTQRSIGEDTLNASRALRAALRQNPDVILAGEMRDRETMELALHAAETGHLVFSTLHTNDAKQSINRLTDAFPPENKRGLLRMLSICLRAVVSQRLIARADGSGRVAAHEVMIVSPTIAQLIEKGEVEGMNKAMESSSGYYRMQSFNQCLAELVRKRLISTESALANSSTPGDLKLALKGMSRGGGTSRIKRGDVELRREQQETPPASATQKKRPRRGPPRPSRRVMGTQKPGTEGKRKSKINRGFDFS